MFENGHIRLHMGPFKWDWVGLRDSGGLAGGTRGPWPPADFFEGAPKFKKGAKT